MRRIIAAVASAAFVLAAGSAFADDMGKGAAKKDAMKMDGMKHETMAKGKKGEMKKDAMAKKEAKDKMKK